MWQNLQEVEEPYQRCGVITSDYAKTFYLVWHTCLEQLGSPCARFCKAVCLVRLVALLEKAGLSGGEVIASVSRVEQC